MKAVRLAILASAILSCSLWGPAQVPREGVQPQSARPSADRSPHEVTWHGETASLGPEEASALALPISGSILTFGAAGAQQTFARRSDLFLGVGSASPPCQSFELLPDGTYSFQVTDPSGKTLLSTDPVSERSVTIKNGVISSSNGTTHAIGPRTACGSLTVGLAPFNDAGFRRAGYVVWLTPAGSFEGSPSSVDPICGQGCFHGFHPELSRAFFFRVEDKASCEPSFCVSGVKFEDRNGNGVRDADERTLPGVEIRVVNASGVIVSTLTGPDGSFRICGLTDGDAFRVFEAVPFGFTQTGPLDSNIGQRVFARNRSFIIESCNADVTGLAFGNQLIPNAVGGVKYEDLNDNGRQDPGEPPLAGVTITLTPAAGGTAQTTVTDANGNFLFTNLTPGNYVLTETVPSGFTQTQPGTATGSIPVTLTAGGSSIANAFGNFRGILTGTISGAKFLDINGNGVRDPGEAGQAGVTITLAGPAGFASRTAVTGTDGTFSFTNLPFGNFTLSETVPAGFRQTAPAAPGTIAASLFFLQSTSANNLFGNQAVGGSIAGTKFNDLNGNGIRDAGEPGLAGVTIRLQPPTGVPLTATTDSAGNFSFTGLNAGTYVLSEVVPSGFVQTAPAAGTISVTLAANQAVTGLLLGNRAAPAGATGSISGSVFLDINKNGVLDAGDVPNVGIVLTLTDANGVQRQTTSGPDGKFSFTNLPAGTYVLSETLPPSFFQTFPGTQGAPGTFTITLAPGQNATGFLFLNIC